MAHKPFNKLTFTESVPSFLKAAMAKHGVKQTSLADKRIIPDDAQCTGSEGARILDGKDVSLASTNHNSRNLDAKADEDRTRKDTEFEKPVVVNVDEISDLNVEQREQLNEIMRKSQKQDIEDAEKGDDDDEDLFIAKKVMRFAAAPSQNVIGMDNRRKSKRKLKFTKNIKDRSKQTIISHEDVEENQEINVNDDQGPPTKKRKIYQEMTHKQLRKRRRKKLKFKTTEISNATEDDKTVSANNNRSMLSFDSDDD